MRATRVYLAYPLDRIAVDTEISEKEIVRLGGEFSRASAPLAIGGGAALAYTNAKSTLMAVNGLNILVGNLGKPGGVQFSQAAPFPHAAGHAVGELGLIGLARDFEQGRTTMLHLYRSNPLFTLPPSTKVRRMFEQAQFIVSFSPFLDESTAMADLILPDHHPLESWGDHLHGDMAPGPTVGLAQPVDVFDDTHTTTQSRQGRVAQDRSRPHHNLACV